jgi:hypothetical protein
MNPWIAIAIFICSIADDILCVLYYRRVNKDDRKFQASMLSGALTAMVSFSVFYYTKDWEYILANVAGSVIGTPLAMWLDTKLPKTKVRDKKGKFKSPIPTPPTIQPGETSL